MPKTTTDNRPELKPVNFGAAASPATSRVGSGGRPRPQATYRAEALRQKIPINLRREPHQRMAKVDDLLQRRAKQIVLAVVPRLAHGSSLTANLAVKGIMNPASRESQNARKPRPAPGFLANRLLAQVKSQRSINRFRILHGQLFLIA
jgi:hypothetical protein